MRSRTNRTARKSRLLINRTIDPDSDEEFDREFKKEFREMEQQSAMFPKLLLAIFLGVAAITLTICAFSTVQTVRALSREQSAPGQVVDMVQRTSRDTSTGEVTTYSYPVVAFAPAGQPVRNVQLSEGSSPPSYTVGRSGNDFVQPAAAAGCAHQIRSPAIC